jgi:DNA/RNA endonuclease YhcR with UshA esterase domain
MNFVNFKGAKFYLVTFKSDVDEFEDGEPADIYDEKRLAVTGLVSIYKEKPQIKLTSPDQVRILEEGEEFPTPGAAKAEKDKGEKKPIPKKAEEKSDDGKKEEPKKKPPVDPKKYFK